MLSDNSHNSLKRLESWNFTYSRYKCKCRLTVNTLQSRVKLCKHVTLYLCIFESVFCYCRTWLYTRNWHSKCFTHGNLFHYLVLLLLWMLASQKSPKCKTKKSQACDNRTFIAALTLCSDFLLHGYTAPRFSKITFASFPMFSADRTQITSAF